MPESDPIIPTRNEMALIKAELLRGDSSNVLRLLRGLAYHGALRIGKTEQEATEMAMNPILNNAQIKVVTQ